jgi:hypothetical protein
MFSQYSREMKSAERGESCRLFSQITAVWRCDNPQSCSASGSDKKVSVPCWTDSKRQHYKLRTNMIHSWIEAIIRKEPNVDIHRPPKSVVDALTAEKLNRQLTASDPYSKSSGVVNNIYYGKRPDTASSQSKAHSTLRYSSPFSLYDDTAEHDVQLFEYGLWLEHKCQSQYWRKEIRKAIDLCDREVLCLEFARKRPLSWWLTHDVKEGVALMFCKSVKRWRDWRSLEVGKVRKVQKVVNAAGIDEYKVITVCLFEEPANDQLPDLPMMEGSLYDIGLIPFSDDGDRLQQHEEAVEEDISQIMAQRLLEFNDDVL